MAVLVLCLFDLICFAGQKHHSTSLIPHLNQDLPAEPITVSTNQVCSFLPISWPFLYTKDRRLSGAGTHIIWAPCAKPLMWGSLSYVVLPLDHQCNPNINQFVRTKDLNLVGYW